MNTITLEHRGQVQYTDSTGKKLTITAEHDRDGGWNLSIDFFNLDKEHKTQKIHLPKRLDKINKLELEPYNWRKRK